MQYLVPYEYLLPSRQYSLAYLRRQATAHSPTENTPAVLCRTILEATPQVNVARLRAHQKSPSINRLFGNTVRPHQYYFIQID